MPTSGMLAWECRSSMFTSIHLSVRTCAVVPSIMSRTMVRYFFFFFCRWKCIQLMVRMEASLCSIVWGEWKFNFNEKSWSWFLMDFFLLSLGKYGPFFHLLNSHYHFALPRPMSAISCFTGKAFIERHRCVLWPWLKLWLHVHHVQMFGLVFIYVHVIR